MQDQTSARMETHSACPVTDIQWLSHDKFVSVGRDGSIGYWSTVKNVQPKYYSCSKSAINGCTVINKGQTLVVGGDDCSLNVYRHSGNSELQVEKVIKDSAPITMVDSFYNNIKFILSCNSVGDIKIWDVQTSECLKVINAKRSQIVGLLKVLCFTTTPDIFLLGFHRGEAQASYLRVDDGSSSVPTILNGRPLHMNPSSFAKEVCQITRVSPKEGFDYTVLCFRPDGSTFLSFWEFKCYKDS